MNEYYKIEVHEKCDCGCETLDYMLENDDGIIIIPLFTTKKDAIKHAEQDGTFLYSIKKVKIK